MAARLTDRKKKKIIADYIELGSYNAVGKKHGVSATTVKKLVMSDTECVKKCEQKKEQNTADILAHMETKKNTVIKIMDAYLEAMLDESKIASATPAQLTTALGTLIDKFTAIKAGASGKDVVDDPLTASLKEEARRMENADQ
jgi:hypothetical protein